MENKAGAGGLIGTDWVVKQPADGYTLIVATAALGAAPAFVAKMPFDVVADLQPVAKLVDLPMLLVASNELPISNLQELFAYARANPGKLNYGAYGVNSVVNILTIRLNQRANVRAALITYRGASQALPEMMAGQLHYMVDGIASAAPLALAGKLKPLAVLSERRHPLLPQVPTIAEAGFPANEASSWFGIASPKGLAPAIVERLSREIFGILQERDVQKAVRDMYMIPTYMPAAGFSDLIRKEVAYWTEASRAAGVKPE